MAVYVIGDIQGCFDPLQRLLEKIEFTPDHDQLWLAGDLVNRGPQSLEVLHWAHKHQDSIRMVLGNHDLHLIGRRYRLRPCKPRDTLGGLLKSDEADEWIHWLRHQPLLHQEHNKILVHGGLLPIWSEDEALTYAREAEAYLQADEKTLAELYKELNDKTLQWSKDLPALKRAAATIKVLTLIRVCGKDGQTIDFAFSGEPKEAPKGTRPWFEVTHQRAPDTQVIFGHWSALGLHISPEACALDTGCVWGRSLTAYDLNTNKTISVPCTQ